jgi:hypothetical protein
MQLQAASVSSSDATAAAASTAADSAGTASPDPTAGAAAATRPRPDRHNKRNQFKETVLKQAGLWLPPDVFKSLSVREQQEVTQRQQQYRSQLHQHKPLRSLHMSAVALNPHQLQVVVALATDAAAGDDSSSSSSSQEAGSQEAAAADIAASSSSSAAQQQQQRRQQQKNQKQQSQQQPKQQQQQAAEAVSGVNPLGYQFVTQPQLDKHSCVKEPSEQPMIVNLNSQMRMAYGQEDLAHAVSLFDQLLAKGIAAAEAAAQPAVSADKQQQQDGEQEQQQLQQQQQQQQQLVLPLQYRPDHSTLTVYCRSLVG